MRIKKQLIVYGLITALLLGMVPASEVSAAKKVSLSAKKLTVKVGQSKKLKLKNNKKKVTWTVTSGKKNISLKSKKKTGVTVVGKKKGSAKIQAKVGKKKYTCKVTVKAKESTKRTKTPSPMVSVQPTKAPTGTATANPTATASVQPTGEPTASAQPTDTPGQDGVLTLYYNDENAEEVKAQIRNSKIPVHLIIEDGVTSIGEKAFTGCSNLVDVTFPSSVTSIGSGAFGLMTEIGPDAETAWLTAQRQENDFVIVNGILIGYGTERSGAITIPDGVTSIGDYAFMGMACSELTSITIPDSVTSIGVGAFSTGIIGGSNISSIIWNGNTYTSVSEFLSAFNNQ